MTNFKPHNFIQNTHKIRKKLAKKGAKKGSFMYSLAYSRMYQFQDIDQIIQCKQKFLDSMRYTVYEKSTPREVKAFTILIY